MVARCWEDDSLRMRPWLAPDLVAILLPSSFLHMPLFSSPSPSPCPPVILSFPSFCPSLPNPTSPIPPFPSSAPRQLLSLPQLTPPIPPPPQPRFRLLAGLAVANSDALCHHGRAVLEPPLLQEGESDVCTVLGARAVCAPDLTGLRSVCAAT